MCDSDIFVTLILCAWCLWYWASIWLVQLNPDNSNRQELIELMKAEVFRVQGNCFRFGFAMVWVDRDSSTVLHATIWNVTCMLSADSDFVLVCGLFQWFTCLLIWYFELHSYRNLFGTLLSLQPQIPSAGHGESREEKVNRTGLTFFHFHDLE